MSRSKMMNTGKAKGVLTSSLNLENYDHAQALTATPHMVKDLSCYMDFGAADHVVSNTKQLDSKMQYNGNNSFK